MQAPAPTFDQRVYAVVAQIPKIEEAFKQAIAAKADPAKAPNQQCRDIATLLKAVADNDAAAYAPVAQSMYASVREYQKNKTPFGEGLLEFLMTPRADALACLDAQIEILADQLAIRLDDSTQRGASVCMRMIAKRSGWGIDASGLRPRAEDNELRDKLAAVLAKAVGYMLTASLLEEDGQLDKSTLMEQKAESELISERDKYYFQQGQPSMWSARVNQY